MIAVQALKERLVNNRLEVQLEEGYVNQLTFSFNGPATATELERLPKETPAAVRSWLGEQNGAKLFEDPEYGGAIELFSIDEILEHQKLWKCPAPFFPVGAGRDGELMVCEYINETENRMWIGEFLSFDEEDARLNRLPFNFSDWLDYVIVAQGASFWNWFRV
ncbi:MAG: SMI1/KNR4 family protein [Exiguobacterium chiriqhucha]